MNDLGTFIWDVGGPLCAAYVIFNFLMWLRDKKR